MGVRQIFGDGCWERGRLARMQAERLLSRLGAETAYQRSAVHPRPIRPIEVACRMRYRGIVSAVLGGDPHFESTISRHGRAYWRGGSASGGRMQCRLQGVDSAHILPPPPPPPAWSGRSSPDSSRGGLWAVSPPCHVAGPAAIQQPFPVARGTMWRLPAARKHAHRGRRQRRTFNSHTFTARRRGATIRAALPPAETGKRSCASCTTAGAGR